MWFVRLQKNDEGNGNSAEEQEPSLTRRVMDVMMMKKTNLEKNVEHYKAEGVKLTGIYVWNNKQDKLSQFRVEFKNLHCRKYNYYCSTNCSSILVFWLRDGWFFYHFNVFDQHQESQPLGSLKCSRDLIGWF